MARKAESLDADILDGDGLDAFVRDHVNELADKLFEEFEVVLLAGVEGQDHEQIRSIILYLGNVAELVLETRELDGERRLLGAQGVCTFSSTGFRGE